MARDKSPAQTLFDDIVNRAVTSVLKPLGFCKSALNFHRRHKDVVQVVNLQSSHGSAWDEKLFYVNVGLAFDAVCQLSNNEILEKPKEYECDSRGTRDRLENLLDNAPAQWSVSVNVRHLGNRLLDRVRRIKQTIAEELQMDSSLAIHPITKLLGQYKVRLSQNRNLSP